MIISAQPVHELKASVQNFTSCFRKKFPGSYVTHFRRVRITVGRCHFGQNCRNEHIYNSGSDNKSGRHSGNNQLDNIIWQISNEVIAAEKGGQWPLSCFAPIKEGLCLPWWEDVSPEEVRWTLYEARKNGTMNQALNQINQWYKNAENARNLVKQPTPEVTRILNDVIKGKKIPPIVTTCGSFTPSINDAKTSFRFDTSINQLFGKSTIQGTNSGSIFGNTGTGFQTQNIFAQSGQSLTSNNTSNIFSRTNENVFSNSGNSGHNIFSGQTQSQGFPNSSVNAQHIFQNQAQTGPFGTGTSVFGAPNPVADNFKANTNISGSAQSNPLAFQNASLQQQAPNNPVKTDGSTFSNVFNKEVDFSIYSKMEDLSENELKSFNSTTFTFGKIPLKPPPQQLC